LLGHWRWALWTQIVLIAHLVVLCWSRWVFEPGGIHFSLGVIALVYLVNTLTCLFSDAKSAKPRMLLTIGFMLIFGTGFTSGYIYKHHWLGVHLYFVPSMSMYPTLKPGEFILLDTWAYQDKTPSLNDVVVFEHGIEKQHLVKRIRPWPNGGLTKETLWYVMGDNRSSSQDSRYFGGIASEQLLGKVKLVLIALDKEHLMSVDVVLTPVH